MLQYSPDYLQWFLLTGSNTLGRGLFILGFLLLAWVILAFLFPGVFGRRSRGEAQSELPSRASLRQRSSMPRLWPGIVGLVLMAIGLVPFYLASPEQLQTEIAEELSETAKFSDVQLLRIDTVAQNPISESAIVYIGTAKDVDGDPRQFRYTQYEKFGVYEMIGFDKPAVDLKDDSFESTKKGLELYRGTAEPEDDEEATPKPTATKSPAAKDKD